MKSDAFENDPYGWTTNQCGHALIGIAASVLTPWAWGGDMITIAAAYWLVSEVLLQRRALFADAAQDTAFVTSGATLPIALGAGYWPGAGVVAIIGAMLALGAWVRR